MELYKPHRSNSNRVLATNTQEFGSLPSRPTSKPSQLRSIRSNTGKEVLSESALTFGVIPLWGTWLYPDPAFLVDPSGLGDDSIPGISSPVWGIPSGFEAQDVEIQHEHL